MSDVNQDVKTGFASTEPVVVGHIVLWVLANIGGFVIAHSHHLLSATQWEHFSTGLTPYISAAVLGLSAFVLRKWVTPAWKAVDNKLTQYHIPVPTETELNALADDLLNRLDNKITARDSNNRAIVEEPYLATQIPAHAGAVDQPEVHVAGPDTNPPLPV